MLMIGDILISDDVVSEQFICNLDVCKGVCCWEGDYGVFFEQEEFWILECIYDDICFFFSFVG